MDNLPDRNTNRLRRETFPVTETKLHTIFLIAGWVALLNVSFALALLYNDYILDNWTTSVLPLWKDDGYFSVPYWLYVYLPVFVFLYGWFELSHYLRLFRDRKHLRDARIVMMPGMVSNLHILNSLGLLAFIAGLVMMVVIEDKFTTHSLLLILWGSYMRIGALVGPRF